MTTNVPPSASTVNYTEYAGDTIVHDITVTDANGNTVDLSNYRIRVTFCFRTFKNLSIGQGIVKTDASNGVFRFTLTAEDTNNIPARGRRYLYGIKIEDESGIETTVQTGTLRLLTRRVD